MFLVIQRLIGFGTTTPGQYDSTRTPRDPRLHAFISRRSKAHAGRLATVGLLV